MKKLLPGLEVRGIDISEHGINDAMPEIKPKLMIHKAQDKYPFKDKEFDLVISITTLHNLRRAGILLVITFKSLTSNPYPQPIKKEPS